MWLADHLQPRISELSVPMVCEGNPFARLPPCLARKDLVNAFQQRNVPANVPQVGPSFGEPRMG